MKNLAGKVAVVTGAASGIGFAMAECFGRQGMKVVLADVEAGPLEAARDAIVRAGVKTIAVRTDVSKAKEVDELARVTFDTFGSAHILCNNAGISAGGLLWQIPLTDWEWILGVNLLGVVHGIRSFVPAMIAQGEGHVVNTASVAGLIGASSMGPYCATKHGVVAVSEVLHYDLLRVGQTKVKVSVLCPSWVKTRILDADRNRPASAPKATDVVRDPAAYQKILSALDAGLPPQVVAEQVLEAVVNEKFWIITHPETYAELEERTKDIVDGRVPQLKVPGQ